MKKKVAMLLVTAMAVSAMMGVLAGAEEAGPVEISGMAMEYNTAPSKTGKYWTNIEEALNVDYTVDWINSDNYYEKLSLNIL